MPASFPSSVSGLPLSSGPITSASLQMASVTSQESSTLEFVALHLDFSWVLLPHPPPLSLVPPSSPDIFSHCSEDRDITAPGFKSTDHHRHLWWLDYIYWRGEAIPQHLVSVQQQFWIGLFLKVNFTYFKLLLLLSQLSHVCRFVTPWTAACQASLSLTISQSLGKLMSIESVMPSNHFILCHPLFLLPSIFPSIRIFSNELALCIRWPKCWSFSFSFSPPNKYSRLISYRINLFDLLAVPGTLRSLLLLSWGPF